MIITTSLMFGGMSDMFGKIVGGISNVMTSAIGSKNDIKKSKKIEKEISIKIDEKMKKMILDMRREVNKQLEEKKTEIIPLMADPVFDKGISIIQRYPKLLPPISDNISDKDIASYVIRIKREEPEASAMFGELMGWMTSLPIKQ